MLHYAESWGKMRQQAAGGFGRLACLEEALAQTNSCFMGHNLEEVRARLKQASFPLWARRRNL